VWNLVIDLPDLCSERMTDETRKKFGPQMCVFVHGLGILEAHSNEHSVMGSSRRRDKAFKTLTNPLCKL
jgi:molybdopterin synthase catalytic subunit